MIWLHILKWVGVGCGVVALIALAVLAYGFWVFRAMWGAGRAR